MSNQETLFMDGNSYGSEVTVVQFVTGPAAGAVGTFFNGSRRINTITFTNLGDSSVTLKVQENDSLSAAGWSDVGSPATIVARGHATIDVSGLVTDAYARIYATSTAVSVVRASINDTDLINNFRQYSPYGQG
jgi:hypothetical protein